VTASDTRFVELYERFYRPVYAYCRRRVSADHVDDVVAETFLVTWKKIDSIPGDGDTLPWLYGVAYRVVSNQWRGRARRQKLDRKLAGIGFEVPPPPIEVIVTGYESRQVVAALESLNPTDREILTLAAWEELAVADIALALDISVGAVRQRLHKAKKNLASAYDKLDGQSKTPAAKKGGGT
jgi:RNA polymerase sigma factor (sigma-70 family)